MKKHSIRPAAKDDLEQIIQIEEEANLQPWNLEMFQGAIESPPNFFWVLTDEDDDDLIFGFIVFQFLEKEAYIQEFAIKNSLRKQGLGAHMVRKVITYVLKKGAESVYLEVRKKNDVAIKFYQQLGFIIIHSKSNFYSNGDDAYSMIFKLKNTESEENIAADEFSDEK